MIKPKEILEQFDLYLIEKKLDFSAIVIGGAALSILGVITRQTQDVDVLDPQIPEEIMEASKLFAKQFNIEETSLKENWLNHGPATLKNYLRPDWRKRLAPLFYGKAVHLLTLGRIDLIGTKVLAYDTNSDWPSYVDSQVRILAEKLGYGI